MKGEPNSSHYDGASCIFEERLWLFGGRTQEDKDSELHRNVDSYDLIHQIWRTETQQLPSSLKGSFFPALAIPEKSQVAQYSICM